MKLRFRIERRFQSLLRRVPPGQDGVARVSARQIYILPTATGLLYAGVLLVMLLGSLNYQNNLGLLFTFFMSAVGLVAMHQTWFNLLGVLVQVRGGPPVFAGEPAVFAVTIGTAAQRPRHDLRIRVGTTVMPPVAIPAGDQRMLTVSQNTIRRGWQEVGASGELTLETHHPMRLFRAWCLIAAEAKTLVYPAPARLAPPPRSAAGTEPRPRARQLAGDDGAEDYLGPRAYRHGDSPRHIDWKVHARARGLVVKQFGDEAGADCWIDWFQLTAPDPELRLSLLTRQVLDTDAARRRFGLRLPDGAEAIAAGPAHLRRCLSRLALFEPVPGAGAQTSASRQIRLRPSALA